MNDYLDTHPTLAKAALRKNSKAAWYAEAIKPWLPSNRNATILEIGPGLAEGLSWLSREMGFTKLHAIDISRASIEVCKQIPNVLAIQTEDTKGYLDVNKTTFELIVMYHVLEHFSREEIVPLLDALFNSLKVSGRLIVVVPNVASPVIGVEQQFFDFTHQTAFSPWSIQQAFNMSRFGGCEVCEQMPPSGGLGRVIQRGLQRGILSIWRAYYGLFSGVHRAVMTHSMVAVAVRHPAPDSTRSA
jgi:hypothetical protein